MNTNLAFVRLLGAAALQGAWLGVRLAAIYAAILTIIVVLAFAVPTTPEQPSIDAVEEWTPDLFTILIYSTLIALTLGIGPALVLGGLSGVVLFAAMFLFKHRISASGAMAAGLTLALGGAASVWLIAYPVLDRANVSLLSWVLLAPPTPVYLIARVYFARALYRRNVEPWQHALQTDVKD